MSVESWDWRYPVDLQDYPWDCSAASLAWALQAYGYAISEAEVIIGLGPSRITPTYGLMDASGAGVVAYLAELGIIAMNNPNCSWAQLEGAAGYQPMICGGREWCHWVGVRMGGTAAGYGDKGLVILANPAPGYMGVTHDLWRSDFDSLGPFSAVWFPA